MITVIICSILIIAIVLFVVFFEGYERGRKDAVRTCNKYMALKPFTGQQEAIAATPSADTDVKPMVSQVGGD